MHRTNPAEQALQTWKSCAKSVVASLTPTFPIAYWCRLFPQINFCVNIVRKCRQNALLPAWAAMEGEYRFEETPIAPPGWEILIHDNTNRRKTWGFNAKKAWCLGPCFQHYHSFRGILPSTGGQRILDTVKSKHHAITIPQLMPADLIMEVEKQLDAAIKQHSKKTPMGKITAIEVLRVLGKHWWATSVGAHFQCSPESDLDFQVEPNKFHVAVCLARPRLPRGTQQDPRGGVPSQ